MADNKQKHRVVIAVMESSPVAELWRAAMQFLGDPQTEVVALFVDDDRWRRAASLSFTREISRLGGAEADFTAQRAAELDKEAVSRTQRNFERLASDADFALAFEVLAESDQKRIQELLGSEPNVLVAPSLITSRPIYAHIERLNCRTLLVETREEKHESE